MRRFVDLHTHSTASDGSLSPEEVVRLAESKRLAALALTDHDTTDGLAVARRAAVEFPELRFIGGVEVSAKFSPGTLHILGLGIDEASPQLQELMRWLRDARNERNPKILAKLQGMGNDITMEDVLSVALQGAARSKKSIVSRLHIAETLRRKKCVRSVQEAFATLIGDGKPAYADKERLTPRQAISAIRDAGGVVCLAHPPQLRYENRAQLERIVRSLMTCGLDGIEVYHSDHTPQQTRLYLNLARRHDLAIVGGSDFHGSPKPDAKLGLPRVPLAAITGDLARRLFNTTQ